MSNFSKLSTEEDLRKYYDVASGRAKVKSLLELEKHCINFIETSPFVVISSFDKDKNMDCSPRGGHPGFVQVVDNKTIVIPDAKGNNRIDIMGNIAQSERVGSLFMIPGIDETLRLNGKAYISDDPKLLALFANDSKPAITCIVIDIEEVFLHCAKAFMRSKLWAPESLVPRDQFPTMGRMLKDQLNGPEEIESHADMVERYNKNL
ncbi:MAG: phosphohydrolase [Thalassobium sp.]|nr:MAG: phosphohydrolase [Thalassobium sp.]